MYPAAKSGGSFSAIPMSNASTKVSLFATKFRFPAQDQSQVERARSEV
jgi:hypothetical protein